MSAVVRAAALAERVREVFETEGAMAVLRRTARKLGRVWLRALGRETAEQRLSPAELAEQARQLTDMRERLARFTAHVQKVRPAHVVVLLSGTTSIQGIPPSRSVRLARALLDLGVPVLFSFHRSRVPEPNPACADASLLQSPVDLTLDLVGELAGADFGPVHKLFVVAYPYPPMAQYVNRLNSHGWVTLYDCGEDWEELRAGAAPWYDPHVESYVVNNCDLTCCASHSLQRKMKGLGPEREVLLSANADDPGFLLAATEHVLAAPSALKGLAGARP